MKIKFIKIEKVSPEVFTAEFVDDYDDYLRIINICELI